MDNQNIISENENLYPENITPKSKFANVWSTIQTFFTFFAFSGLFAFFLPSGLTSDTYLILTMLGCGVLSVIISCIVDVVKFALRIARVALTPMLLFAFLPLLVPLVSVIMYTVICGLVCGICIAFPYITTLIAYTVKSRKAKKSGMRRINKKREFLAAAVGLFSAVVLFVICNMSHDAAIAKSPVLREELNASKQQLYTEYINTTPTDCVEKIDFSNPSSSKFEEETLSQYDNYEFDSNINGVVCKNTVTIQYSYHNGKWYLMDITEHKNLSDATLNVSGTFNGMGRYGGIIGDANYKFNIDNLTKEGGRGSIKIYLEESNETLATAKCNINVTRKIKEDEDIILNLNIVFDKNDSEVSGTYSVASGELKLSGFYASDEIIFTAE